VISLLLAGHVSDWYGRRTVLTPALVVAVVAAVVFLLWRSRAGCSSRACSRASLSVPPSRPPPRS
jgi:MFS family permease